MRKELAEKKGEDLAKMLGKISAHARVFKAKAQEALRRREEAEMHAIDQRVKKR